MALRKNVWTHQYLSQSEISVSISILQRGPSPVCLNIVTINSTKKKIQGKILKILMK